MSEAIRGNQRQSDALRGTQRQSEAVRWTRLTLSNQRGASRVSPQSASRTAASIGSPAEGSAPSWQPRSTCMQSRDTQISISRSSAGHQEVIRRSSGGHQQLISSSSNSKRRVYHEVNNQEPTSSKLRWNMASSMQPRLETFAAECAISFVRAAAHVSRSAVVSAASDGGESALVGGVPLMTACSAASIEATGSGAPVTASRSSTCPTASSSAIRETLGRHRAQSAQSAHLPKGSAAQYDHVTRALGRRLVPRVRAARHRQPRR